MRVKKRLLAAAAVLAVAVPAAVAAVIPPAAAAVNPLPVTVTNNTGRSDPLFLYILSENLTTHAQGFVNAGGQFTPWSGGGIPPTPAPDVSIPGPANGGSVTLLVPQGVNGRIYFSFGERLKLLLVSGGLLVQPAPWVAGDANFNILMDWSEFTYDNAGLFLNSSQVDTFAVPHVVAVDGANGHSETGLVVPDGRNKVINAIKAQAGFDRTVVTRADGTVLRVLSPGKAQDGGFMSPTYLDAYITEAWNAYASQPLVVQPFEDTPSSAFTGRTSGNTMTFTNSSGAQVATFQKPATRDVWNCDGALLAPNDLVIGPIARTLCAALHRSTLGKFGTEPQYSASSFYQGALTNHYSRIVHANMVDGKAYGFPFDDVGHFESLVKDPSPNAAAITLSPF